MHAQLLTRSKMFCSCSADYTGAPPNGNTCPVCLGLPGALPVMNRQAVEMTVRTALALNCEIPPFTKFDRKNYFYPDLPKGYQISQYDLPLSQNGHLEFDVNGERTRCGITRVHLEEDTGTMHHAGDVLQEAQSSLVDLNRCGVPLDGDRRRAGPAQRRRRRASTWCACARSSCTSASTTATWSRGRCAATPTSRCAAPATPSSAPRSRSRT